MTERRNFNREYIEKELERLAANLPKKTAVFIAGGAAMAFYGLKEATKDIDVVVESKGKVDSLVSALRSFGYMDPRQALTVNYTEMKTSAILENPDGFRWDMFEQVVAGRLRLSKGMIERSQKLLYRGSLQARLLSKEDIFLLKSVTERDRDIEDMGIVAESGLDWDVVAKECRFQASHSVVVWEDALCDRLMELREKRGIASPIEKMICRIADQKILEAWITRKVREGINTVRGLASESGEPDRTIREAIRRLACRRIITVNRSIWPYRFMLREKNRTS
jgi:hypothetical protein